MAVEQFTNNATTTLSAAITDTTGTSLSVADASAFPSSPQFRILIDSELMLVTAVSGTTFTVTRGAEGTTAATHANGATVSEVLTAGALAQFRADDVATDTLANRPAAGIAGRLFLPTDSSTIQRDNGTNWEQWGPLGKFTAPVDADFSWVNQGTASVSTSAGGIFLLAPQTGTSDNRRLRVKALPAAPYTITVNWMPVLFTKNNHGAGLIWRDSATAKMIVVGLNPSGAGPTSNLTISKFTDITTFSANYFDQPVYDTPHWFQLVDDGTNRIVRIGPDGRNWITVHSVLNTDFLVPNQVGFMANAKNAAAPNLDVAVLILSWQES